MSEIEKLYENAGVQSFKTCEFCTQKNIDCLKENTSNITCGLSKDAYPPFTSEKQLELIKWLAKNKFVVYNNLGGWHVGTAQTYSEELGIVCKYNATNIDFFEEALARLINNLWQNLSPEEKQQIKEILE